MNIEIEKGIPLPGQPGSPAQGFTNALRAMQPGDSFLFPKKRRVMLSALWKRVGGKFMSRSVDEENIRVWRIE